jgi:hypothetical protein
MKELFAITGFRRITKKFICLSAGIALLVLFTGTSYAQKDDNPFIKDTIPCLMLSGKLDATMKNAEGPYTAKLILNNKVIDQQVLKGNKSFKFTLNKDMLYTVQIEKEDFVPRLLSISTKLPKKVDLTGLDGLFRFKLEINLISKDLYHSFDDDDLDFPIALINYGYTCNCFEYNKKYTESLMNRMINKMLFGS